MIRIYLALSRLGARLGNWNDQVNATGDRSAEHPRRWHVIDRVSSRLYVLGDRVDLVARMNRRPHSATTTPIDTPEMKARR